MSSNQSQGNLRRLGRGLRDRITRQAGRPYVAAPHRYWERRHQRYGVRLDGVGQIGLGHEANERDYEAKWEHIEDLLDQFEVTETWSVIDAGCGIGWFTERLVERGHETHGVDFSQEAVSLARERTGDRATFEVSPLDSWTPHEEADLVLCIDVLFHIVDDSAWHKALDGLADATRPGGLLVIQEHLENGASSEVPHVKWRAMSDYQKALPGWELVDHVRYDLPASGSRKDLIVWQRTAPT